MKKLLLLCFLCFIFLGNNTFSQTMETAPYYDMTSWNSSPYQSFKITGGTANPYYDMTFRLLYPKTYDPSLVSTEKYPLILMLHGAGESALGNNDFGNYPVGDPRRFNNDHQLLHQGPQYLSAVNNGKWPGFVLFPQNPNGFWTGQAWLLNEVNEMLQVLIQTQKVDPNKIYICGLSSGAHGVWDGIARFTNLFAAALPFSGIGLPNYDNTTRVAHLPIWYFQGGRDTSPSQYTADQTINQLRNVGGTPKYTVYPTLGHGTWNAAIAEPDFFPFMQRYSKLSIHVYYGKTEFEPDETINVKLGISPGFSGYEWKKDNLAFPGASNEIIVSSAGSYQVRFRRGSEWTAWSDPVVIKRIGDFPPTIVTHPLNVTVSQGNVAAFSVTVNGTPPFTYQWQKNGVNISGANSDSYSIANAQPSNNGLYRVIVTNAFGNITSNTAQLTVNPPNTIPVASITTPPAGSFYRGGETILFSGEGTDVEDGTLPASAFAWKVDFYKDGVSSAGPSVPSGVKSGSFVIPSVGETSANVFYRISLTVTDAQNAKHTATRDLDPRKTTISLTTQPTGLQLNLDNSAVATPYAVSGVEGIQRTLGIISPQTISGQKYVFSHWQHGGNATQTISTPIDDITYTAIFEEDNTPAENGLNYAYYEGTWTRLPDFDNLTAIETGTVSNIDLSPRNRDNLFGFVFTGYLDIPITGQYTLYLRSDDGSKLFIDNAQVIDLDGNHSAWERSASLNLSEGKHAIRVIYFDKEYDQILSLSWARSGVPKQLIPNSAFFLENVVVNTPPSITTQPQAISLNIGQTANFSVSATGSAPLSYQWQKNGVNISGATSNTYSISNVQTSHAGTYRAVVSNDYGDVTTNGAALTVNTPPTLPTIDTQPSPVTVNVGGIASFSVEASGTAPLAYQWQKNGVNIPGAASMDYSINNVQASNAGMYRVVVSNSGGSVTSNAVQLTVSSPPVIADQPSDITVSVGQMATFSVTANGSNPLSYQWKKHGTNISGANSSSYSIPNAQLSDAGTYSVFISNSLGNTTSIPAQLTVNETPENGLNYSYYEGTWTRLPDFNALTPVESGTVQNIDLSPRNQDNLFGFVFTGFLDIPVSAQYTLYLRSDDGSKLFVDNVQVIDLDGNHAAWERSVNLSLSQGKHAIRVIYFDREYDQILSLSWARSGVPKQLIPSSAFYLENNAALRIAPLVDFENELEKITIHPNPSSDQITVGLNSPINEWVKVSLINQLGKVVKTKVMITDQDGANSVVMNVSDLIYGAYNLKVQKGNSVHYNHLIIGK